MYIGVTPTSSEKSTRTWNGNVCDPVSRDDLECKRRASLEVSLQFASFFQYDVYYKVVSCASNPKESSR
jgi:hypothetical protein